MESTDTIQPVFQKPLFEPSYLNIEYVFNQIYSFIKPIIAFFTDGHNWEVIGLISMLVSIFCIAIIVYSIVRMREIQLHEKEEIDHEIHEALLHDAEKSRDENPRWHYIQTLVESPNESDWRVAIIEADTMLEEILHDRGYEGTTLSELLEGAKSGGIATIQNAWDAHLVRNQIAHAGLEFPLTQIEARRVIRMYQNVFEEFRAI